MLLVFVVQRNLKNITLFMQSNNKGIDIEM